MKRTIFVTGTDTGVGKTVVTMLLAGFFREHGIRVAALKPICSGGREDARILRGVTGGELALDEINPWYFRMPVAPAVAARREKKTVKLAPVLAHIRAMRKSFDLVLIEGAGGLLSPLGEDFDSRDLICALQATPVIAAPNRLGVVNHVRLTLEALPENLRAEARVVLLTPPRPDLATKSNAGLLEQLSAGNICRLPWFGAKFSTARVLRKTPVRRVLAAIAGLEP